MVRFGAKIQKVCAYVLNQILRHLYDIHISVLGFETIGFSELEATKLKIAAYLQHFLESLYPYLTFYSNPL